MAIKVFLGVNDLFTVANNDVSVVGANAGNEKVLIQSGVTGTILDPNIERIELAGNLADYKFVAIAGTGIQIVNAAGTVIGTLGSLNQNSKVAFADGSAALVQTGGTAFTLGGQAVTVGASAAAAAAITSASMGASFDTTDKSTVTPVVVGQAFTLTTGVTNYIGTIANDTFDGVTNVNSLEGRSIIDPSTTDADVLNAKLSSALTNATTVMNVETINIDWDGFSAAAIAADKITGTTTINLSSTKLGYLGDANITAAGKNTIVAGSGIKGALSVTGITTGVIQGTNAKTITAQAAGTAGADDTVTVTAGATTTTINVGTATAFDAGTVTAGAATTAIDVRADKTATITTSAATTTVATTAAASVVNASAIAKNATITLNGKGAADSATITIGDDVTVVSALADTAELLTLDVAAGKTVTVDGPSTATGDKMEIKGAGDVTLKILATDLTADTVTKSNTGTLTVDMTAAVLGAAVDTAKVQADLFKATAKTGAGGAEITAKSGQNFEVAAESATSELTVGVKTNGAADTLTVKLTSAAYAAVKQGANDINTLTINAAAAQAAGSATAIDLTIDDLVAGATNKVVLTGTNDVKLTKVSSAKEIDASALNGTLNIGAGTAVATGVIAGATGVNTIAFGAVVADTSVTFIGQGGKDVVSLVSVAAAGAGTVAGQANILTGAGDDKLTVSGVVAGVLSANTGDGDDTVIIQDSPTGTVVLEFGAGADTLKVKAGKTFAGANLTMTDLETIQFADTGKVTFAGSQLTGKTYAVKGVDGSVDMIAATAATGATDENIDLSGLVVTDSVATGLKGAEITGNDGKNVLTGTTRNDVIAGGKGNDTIVLSAGGSDTVKFELVANNGKDTITGFTAGTDVLTKDVLTVSDLATLGTNGTKTVFQKANASSTDKASVVTASITANGDGVITLKDQAAADWSDVATVVGNALTVDGTAGNNSEFVILVDNGTDTRIYAYKDVTDGFDAGDITLVATVSAVQTYTTTGVFDASNFA